MPWENAPLDNECGTAILGVHLVIEADQHVATLKQLRDMPLLENIVHLEGSHTGVTMWFSGPRQAGDFIAYWCSTDHPLRSLSNLQVSM